MRFEEAKEITLFGFSLEWVDIQLLFSYIRLTLEY